MDVTRVKLWVPTLALAALTGSLAGAICAAFEFVADYLIERRFDFLDAFEGR